MAELLPKTNNLVCPYFVGLYLYSSNSAITHICGVYVNELPLILSENEIQVFGENFATQKIWSKFKCSWAVLPSLYMTLNMTMDYV